MNFEFNSKSSIHFKLMYSVFFRRGSIAIIFFFCMGFSGFGQSPSFKTYMNPVIPGDHPDPGLIKAGKDFFTTGSAFNPSAVIYHSTDLVHWEVSSHPVDAGWSELGDCPACGMWGGSMAYFSGSYWDYFGNNGAMWFVKSASPFGPWGTPVRMTIPSSAANGLGIDNSIFVDDDGTAYLVAKPGQDKNQIFKLNPQGQCTGEKIDLGWMNPSPTFPLSWAEGPVMCKRNGWYYYFVAGNAAGGQYAFRSKTLTGNKDAWQAFGDIFSTADHSSSLFYGPNHSSTPVVLEDSTWWAIIQSYAFTWTNDEWQGQGRQGLLCQYTWNASGRPTIQWPVNSPLPAPVLSSSGIPWMVPKSDFFDSEKLNVEWEFLGRTPSEMYSVSDRPGWLRLKPGTTMNHIIKNDAEHAYSLITRLDFDATATGEEAGIRITNGLVNEKNLDARLFSTFSGGKKTIAFSFNTTRYDIPNLTGNVLWLKLVRVSHLLTAYFSINGEIWLQVGNTIDVSSMDKNQPDSNGWIGNRQGLYAQNRTADFDLYIYRDAYTPIMAECPANQWGTNSIKSADGILDLDNIHNQDWALYAGVEFGGEDYKKTAVQFELKASTTSGDGIVEIWLDSIQTGNKIGECLISNTGDWNNYNLFTFRIEPVTGRHDVYLVFAGSGTGKLYKIRSFSFVSKEVSEYISSKVEGDPGTIQLKLSVPVILPGIVSGIEISINGITELNPAQYSINVADSSFLLIKLNRDILKSDEVRISYNNGNLLTADSADLISFSSKLVENLLPGSAPRLIQAQTSVNGTSLELSFNKPMQLPQDTAGIFIVKITTGSTKEINTLDVNPKPDDPFTLVIIPAEKMYAEYSVSINYSGNILKSTDDGTLAAFVDFPVKNISTGMPPFIVSSKVKIDGLSFSLVFNKDLTTTQGQAGFFSVKVNDEISPIDSIRSDSSELFFNLKIPVRYGDTILLSYSGETFGSVDSGILEKFSDFPVENDLPEPIFNVIPGIIEAENFVSNFGTQIENTADDGGGSAVGWIDANDYLDFAVEVLSSGFYTISARVASPNSGTRFLLQKPGLTNINLDTVLIPNTGNLQTWKTVYSLIYLEAGRQYIRKRAWVGGYSINWIRFETGNTMPIAQVLNISTDMTGKKIEITFDKELGNILKAIDYFNLWVDGKETYISNITLKTGNKNILVLNLSVAIQPTDAEVLITLTGGGLKAFDNTPLPAFEKTLVKNITSVHFLETNNSEVKIYPNPVKNEITIESESRYERIEICDLTGKLVFSKDISNYEPARRIKIDLNQGFYYITLWKKSEKLVSGIIIE